MPVKKEAVVEELKRLRWVGKTRVAHKWYPGTLKTLVRPDIIGGRILSHGFRSWCTVNEVLGIIMEPLRSKDVWGCKKEGPIIGNQDISTAFDEVIHEIINQFTN